jgi:hypothetical protein
MANNPPQSTTAEPLRDFFAEWLLVVFDPPDLPVRTVNPELDE